MIPETVGLPVPRLTAEPLLTPEDPRPRPVTVLGDVAVDVVVRHAGLVEDSDSPAEVRLHGGGAGANTAAWLARLGVSTTLVGRVGDDEAGRSQTLELSAYGVRCSLAVDADAATGCVVVLVGPDGRRTMLPDRGANALLAPDDLPFDWPPGGHLHVSGYPLLDDTSRPAARAAISFARDAGWTVSVDPASAGPLARCPEFVEWTTGCDHLLPNLDEAAVLTGVEDPREAALLLAGSYGEVLVSCGSDGAVWASGSEAVAIPAAPTPSVLDTTGAGDALAAAFLSRRLAGASGPEAARYAVVVAAEAVSTVGARPA